MTINYRDINMFVMYPFVVEIPVYYNCFSGNNYIFQDSDIAILNLN